MTVEFTKLPLIKQTRNTNSGAEGTPDSIYTVDPNKWYSTYPYGFRHTPRSSDGTNNVKTFFLPINPTDITTSTNFATNTLSSLYGVIEEHSEVRYYDVNIRGTTGFAPRYINSTNGGNGLGSSNLSDAKYWQSSGRTSQSSARISLGGALPQLTNVINQAKNAVQEITGGQTNESGLYIDQTGYLAFHNFYRFLLIYKKDASGELGFGTRKKHPLTWLNYKDGTKMDCVINGFTMVRSASNPFMYEYSISMRCYNLRSIDAEDQDTFNGGDMGLSTSGLSITNNPLFAKISNKAKAITNAINSITGIF